MASRKEEHAPEPQDSEPARSLIYLPCPACGRAVQLSDDNRARGEPDTYVCPSCAASFVVDVEV
jgi:predicted RNA-binding Zn-ribbon protein involved in translation (DUF1610 family)